MRWFSARLHLKELYNSHRKIYRRPIYTTQLLVITEKYLLLISKKIAKEYVSKFIEFVRSVTEGNLVVLHTHQV